MVNISSSVWEKNKQTHQKELTQIQYQEYIITSNTYTDSQWKDVHNLIDKLSVNMCTYIHVDGLLDLKLLFHECSRRMNHIHTVEVAIAALYHVLTP